MSQNLSAHFTLREAARSDYAARHGIDNTLPSIYYDNARAIAENILEPVRLNFGIPFSPNSWYRGGTLNSAIGGSKKSQHCTASAVDIEIPSITNMELAIWISENLTFDQLILECYTDNEPSSGWVHVSYAKENRNQILRYNNGEYKQGLM